MGTVSWPETLWLVRHGESAGNVARDLAEERGHEVIAIEGRDVDVPLSRTGEEQASALGAWFQDRPRDRRPTVILSSPYVRARQTAEALASRMGPLVPVVLDERLREKEFGSLNRLTRAGVLARYPAEAERRAEVGKFYYRPPGGESWCDVILRARSLLHHMQLQHAGERVLIVAHQVVILAFRYLIEELDEARLLAIDADRDVANCSVTVFEAGRDAQDRSRMLLRAVGRVDALQGAGVPVTASPDPQGAR